MEKNVNIPIYHNFTFYCLEFDCDVFHSRRNYYSTITSFWEKIYCTFFNKEAKEYLRQLVDYTINCPFHDLDAFGITFLNEDTPQFRNTRIVYNTKDILNHRTTFDTKGRRVYKEHDPVATVAKLVHNGVNAEWAEDLVRCVNGDEREIISFLAERQTGKEWNYLKSYFLTRDYIIKKLRKEGIAKQHITYELMEAEIGIIETTRKLKQYIK